MPRGISTGQRNAPIVIFAEIIVDKLNRPSECDDVIRRAHVSRKREQQATGSKSSLAERALCPPPTTPKEFSGERSNPYVCLEQILGWCISRKGFPRFGKGFPMVCPQELSTDPAIAVKSLPNGPFESPDLRIKWPLQKARVGCAPVAAAATFETMTASIQCIARVSINRRSQAPASRGH